MPLRQATKYRKRWIGIATLKPGSSLSQLDVHTATWVQTFDFSIIYTAIPHNLLKSRISNVVHNAFIQKNGSVRYTHIKVARAKGHLAHDINGSGDNMYTAKNGCNMIEFLIDNIFVRMSFPSGNWNPDGKELCSIT